MNSFIEALYASKSVVGMSGAERELSSEINRQEGALLEQIIQEDSTISRTLEVGCACGLSSLHICHSLLGRANAEHTAVDPFQFSQWDGIGVKHLKESGIAFFRLIEQKSEFALPDLLKTEESRFDLIFIDGMHTFDHTLLDCFYAIRLLRTGGYLVVHDCAMPSVHRAIDYVSSYPCFKVHREVSSPYGLSTKRKMAKSILDCLSPQKRKELIHPEILRKIYMSPLVNMVALKKISEDQRSWDWFPAGF